MLLLCSFLSNVLCIKDYPFICQVNGLIFPVQRELGASRQEHDIGPANQPEKEEQKQRKDNR